VKPWRSGHCGLANPAHIHQQCAGGYCRPDGTYVPCVCDCHDIKEPAMTAPAPRAGFVHDLDEATYHSDRNSLSVSGAKVILKAPALFRWQQDHPVYKKVFDAGSAAHKLVLGVGDPIVIVQRSDPKTGEVIGDADDYKSPSAREHADKIRAEHGIPLLRNEYDVVQAMADELSSHRLAMQLLSEGQPEVSAYAPDEPTGVVRRGRFDWLGPTIVTDYKTAVSSEPNAFVRAAVSYGYQMQAGWYLDLAADLGHPAQAFAFIVQEKTAPYLVTVIELPPELVAHGRERNRRALERFRDCTESGRWPGYVPDDQFATPSAPSWATRDEEYAQ